MLNISGFPLGVLLPLRQTAHDPIATLTMGQKYDLPTLLAKYGVMLVGWLLPDKDLFECIQPENCPQSPHSHIVFKYKDGISYGWWILDFVEFKMRVA